MTPEQKKLVEDHAYLVPALVRNYSVPQPWGREDLVSAGYEALCTAAERWDASRRIRFSTYANHRICGAFRDEMRRLCWGTRTEPDWYHYLTDEDSEMCSALFYDETYESLREERSDEMIERLVATLPKTHRKVVEMRLSGSKFVDVSRHLGVSPSRISQIYSEALRNMREAA